MAEEKKGTLAEGEQTEAQADGAVQTENAKKVVRTTTTTVTKRVTANGGQGADVPTRRQLTLYGSEGEIGAFFETEDEMPLLELPAEKGAVRVMGSFAAKLSMCAGTPVMEYYSVLKSVLLYDHRVKSRNNWQFETLFYGRDQAARFAIQGGRLTLYLALRPCEYDAAKYGFQDVGIKKKYEYVPMMLEITGDDALRNAVELCCELLWRMGLTPGKPDPVSYQVEAESWERLYREGYVEFLREWGDGTSQIITSDATVLDAFLTQAERLPTLTFAPVDRGDFDLSELLLPEMPGYYRLTRHVEEILSETVTEEVTEELVALEGSAVVAASAAPVAPAEPQIREVYIEVPVERIVERIVEVDRPIKVPVPIERIVERVVEVEKPVGVIAIDEEPDTRYRYSYVAKLVSAPRIVKDYYNTIKNRILSYQDVEGDITWESERFSLNERTLVQLAIRGKAVYLYLALDPKAYKGTKYIVDDVSHQQKYADVPLLLRVETERTLRCGLELIDALCTEAGAKQGNRPVTDFRPAFLLRDALVQRGVVRATGEAIDSEQARLAAEELIPAPAPFVTEEAPEKPAPKSKQKKKPAAEKKPPKEKPVEEKKPAIDDDPDSEVITDAEGHSFRVYYRRSYAARLSHASDAVRTQYNALKSRLLAIAGAECRTTWDGEVFTVGDNTIAHMLVKNKSLYLYLALDPHWYRHTHYSYNDVSEDKRWKDVPMEIRIRSDWSLRQTLKLVEDLASAFECAIGESKVAEHCPAYRTTEQLVADGLIKTRTVAL